MKNGSTIDKVNWALHRAKTEKLGKAKWVLYGAVGISSLLLLGCDGPQFPKFPKGYGD
jgi:hypothetical protein